MSKNNNFTELSSASISESKKLIISQFDKGGFTIAQQLVAKDQGKLMTIFLKDAIHIEDESGLYNLRDAVNLAIQKIEKK